MPKPKTQAKDPTQIQTLQSDKNVTLSVTLKRAGKAVCAFFLSKNRGFHHSQVVTSCVVGTQLTDMVSIFIVSGLKQ